MQKDGVRAYRQLWHAIVWKAGTQREREKLNEFHCWTKMRESMKNG